MTAIPVRKGYLSTTVREIREAARAATAQSTPGVLTSRTTGGVIRRPIARRKTTATGGGSDTWAA